MAHPAVTPVLQPAVAGGGEADVRLRGLRLRDTTGAAKPGAEAVAVP